MRTLNVGIRLTAEQHARLKEIAKRERRTLANLLNLLIDLGESKLKSDGHYFQVTKTKT